MQVEITGLVGIYTDPRHVIAYAEGEVRQLIRAPVSSRNSLIDAQWSVSRAVSPFLTISRSLNDKPRFDGDR